MTQAEMIDNMCRECGHDIPKTAMERAFKQVFSDIKEACAAGDTVSIRSFGTFSLKDCQERNGRNPQTREAISIPAKKKISFKNSSVLKEYL